MSAKGLKFLGSQEYLLFSDSALFVDAGNGQGLGSEVVDVSWYACGILEYGFNGGIREDIIL